MLHLKTKIQTEEAPMYHRLAMRREEDRINIKNNNQKHQKVPPILLTEMIQNQETGDKDQKKRIS